MAISFSCEHCGVRIKVPNEVGGKRAKCAQCGKKTRIPVAPSMVDTATSLTPVQVSDSGELVNTLAPGTDTGPPELEHERLALERARLEYDRRKLESERRALERLDEEEEPNEEDDSSDELMECPACAEEIKARAKLCKHCGSEITRDRRGRAKARQARSSTRIIAVAAPPAAARGGCVPGLLSFVIPGMGQLYKNEPSKAAIFLVGFIASCFVFPPVAVVIWIVSVVDGLMG